MDKGEKLVEEIAKALRKHRRKHGEWPAGVWLAPERFWQLPPDLIGRAIGKAMAGAPNAHPTICGVRVGLIEVLPPLPDPWETVSAARWGGSGPSAGYRHPPGG